MIEAGENALRDLGFYDVVSATTNSVGTIVNSATNHGTSKQPVIHLARIEIGPSEFSTSVAKRRAFSHYRCPESGWILPYYP